jgi:hypothetical protein
MAYTLKPGKSLIYLPVDYEAINCPDWLSDAHQSLDAFNYAPVPFTEFSKRQFVTVQKCSNGDLYEGQWSAEGKRDGFGYNLGENGRALYEGYWCDGRMHGTGRLTNEMGFY